MSETHFKTKIRILNYDNGIEYFNQQLTSFLHKKDILHQATCHDTPQKMELLSENRHLLEVVHTLTFSMNVPKYLWGDAVLTIIYLINQMLIKASNFKTPLNHFKNYFPTIQFFFDLPIKLIGCAYVHNPKPTRTKLDPRTVGYVSHKKAYKNVLTLRPKNILRV